MERVAEIKAIRARIKNAIEQNEKDDEKSKYVSEIPAGFYNKKDMEKYLKVDGLFFETIAEFMADLGIRNYYLEKRFSVFQWCKSRIKHELIYQLNFSRVNPDNLITSSFSQKDADGNGVPIEYFNYDGGGLKIIGALILVPEKHAGYVEVPKAIKYLQDEHSKKLRNSTIYLLYNEINKKSIKDLLTIVVSNPKLRIDF